MIRSWLALLGCLLGVQCLQAGEFADPEVAIVTLDSSSRLRALAERYLGDPDAWPEILTANGLDALDRVRPGMTLRIPVGERQRLDQRLVELRRLIYESTKTGAQVFAIHLIEEAMSRLAEATRARRDGTLADSAHSTELGLAAAREALALSQANRSVPAEAILVEAGGRVQRQRPDEFDWTPIQIQTLLAERERLRTLSASFAQVRFRDASRIQMGEHAQLAIRRLRRDDLTRSEVVDVVLYGGDLRALIGANAGRQRLRVETPGIEAEGDSRHYWVQRTPEQTRIANFDGEISISAEGESVRVRRNQGTLVDASRPPAPPRDLLPPPEPIEPDDGARLHPPWIELRWSPRKGARYYWLEIARDPDFTRLVLTDTTLEQGRARLNPSEEGDYYWRLSAVDAAGLPGPPTQARRFELVRDETPPYLSLAHPADDLRTREPDLVIAGRTEPAARLTIDDKLVPVASDGRFEHPHRLLPGANRLVLEARDPAGNVTRRERLVHLLVEADEPPRLQLNAPRDATGRLLSVQPWLVLEGVTEAGASLLLAMPGRPGFRARSTADVEGHFSLTLPVDADLGRFTLDVITPSGQSRRDSLEVVLDQTPPRIHLDTPPPSQGTDPNPILEGWVEDGESLTADDRPVTLAADGRFSLAWPLLTGNNHIRLLARDRAGNVTSWHGSTRLDQEPPTLVETRLRVERQDRQPVLVVEIEARDEAGVLAAIPYRLIRGDGSSHAGVARRDQDREVHRDQLTLVDESQEAAARLSAVTLIDYLGNRREIELD